MSVPGIHLDPEDWLFATWRPRVIQPRPEPPPFHRGRSVKRAVRLNELAGTIKTSRWNFAQIDHVLGEQEARFWLLAIKALQHKAMVAPDLIQTAAEQWDVQTTPDFADTLSQLDGLPLPPAIVPILAALYPWDCVLEFVRQLRAPRFEQCDYDDVFRRGLLPYLTEEQLDGLRHAVRIRLMDDRPAAAILVMAGLVGIPADVEAWLIRTCRFRIKLEGAAERAAFFGLESAAAVTRYEPALGSIRSEQDLRAWLAHTGADQLKWVIHNLLGASPRLFFQLVSSPALAPHLLRIVELQGSAEARAWFQRHPAEAAAGLEGYEWKNNSNEGKRLNAAAAKMLSQLRSQPSAATEVNTLPGDLDEQFSRVDPNAEAPAWIKPSELPQIRLQDGAVLPESRIERLLVSLSLNEPLKQTPLVIALRKHADGASLDQFADELFEAWRRAGMNPRGWWALGAVGLLGGEQAGLRLWPHVRSWPGKSRYEAAKLGRECLRKIATPAILWQILRASTKSGHALEFINQHAIGMNISASQLEDRLIPTCGLDARGARMFDFGPRQFTVKLGRNLEPIVIEPGGKRKNQLPKPNAKDDSAKADTAIKAWTTFKKDLAEVARSQAKRLEEAFLRGIAWLPEDFTTYLIPHPVVGLIIPTLIWGAFDSDQNLLVAFRVTEENTFADMDDRTIQLPVNIIHIRPLRARDLDEPARLRWSAILADYELIPPFSQLQRLQFRIKSGRLHHRQVEVKGDPATRGVSQGLTVMGYTEVLSNPAVIGLTKRQTVFYKSFSDRNVIAHLQWGVEAFGVGSLSFSNVGLKTPLPFHEVEPLILADVLADLYSLSLEVEDLEIIHHV